MNYEAMAEEEIEAAKAELKSKIDELRAEMGRAEDVLRGKRMLGLAQQALANAGVTGVAVSPEPATIAATPEGAATEGGNS